MTWSIHELLHGTTPLLVRVTSAPGSDIALVAQNLRWAQGLGGDEPRGLIAGSVEPLRQRAQRLPNTHATVRAAGLVGDGPPRDDGQWRVRHLHSDLPSSEVASVARDEAQARGCAAWVPTTLLGHNGPHTQPGRTRDRQVCTSCHMDLPLERFPSDADACRDCV